MATENGTAKTVYTVLLGLGAFPLAVVFDLMGLTLSQAIAVTVGLYAAAGLVYWRHVRKRPVVRPTPKFDGRFFPERPGPVKPSPVAIAAKAEAARKQANQKIIDSLGECLHYGTHEVLNRLRPALRDEHLQAWIRHRSRWEHATRQEMQAVGCAGHEIASFWDYTAADLNAIGVIYPNRIGPHNQLGQGVQFRLNALKRIINQRSGTAVYPNV